MASNSLSLAIVAGGVSMGVFCLIMDLSNIYFPVKSFLSVVCKPKLTTCLHSSVLFFSTVSSFKDYYIFTVIFKEEVISGSSRKKSEKTAHMASLYAVAYNGTEPTGGDSLTSNLNEYYEVSHEIASEN